MEHIWAVIGASHEAVIEIALAELLHAAINAGMGSEKAECVGDILVSLTSTTIRGKIIAKLRKVQIASLEPR